MFLLIKSKILKRVCWYHRDVISLFTHKYGFKKCNYKGNVCRQRTCVGNSCRGTNTNEVPCSARCSGISDSRRRIEGPASISGKLNIDSVIVQFAHLWLYIQHKQPTYKTLSDRQQKDPQVSTGPDAFCVSQRRMGGAIVQCYRHCVVRSGVMWSGSASLAKQKSSPQLK